MPYQVRFTETTNPAKPSITVNDQSLDKSTSVTFVGKNYAGYGSVIAENFLHLLENFARNTPPGTQAGEGQPVQGQLWYDNNPGKNILKVWDGTYWQEAGSVKKNSTQPTVALNGDIWVDTQNHQVYVYSGSNWLLVGPQYSSGIKTGPFVETIVASDNSEYPITSVFSGDTRIAIVSSNDFTPKAQIPGFATISRGITLNTLPATVNGTTQLTKFAGTASSADSLIVNGTAVSATNFLRSDTTSATNNPFNVRSNSGITLGSDLSFNIGTNINQTVFYSKTGGNSVDFKLTDSLTSSTNTVLHLNARGKVGIGNNNTAPALDAVLDVKGNVYTDSAFKVATTTNNVSTVVSTYGAGLNVNDDSIFSKKLTVGGVLELENRDYAVTPAAILPSINLTFDIGSESKKFRNVYAQTIVGDVTGTFTGDLTGNVSGSAAKLASPTPFSITGDVTSNTVQFDGENDIATFTTTVSSDIIINRSLVTSSDSEDRLLIYRNTVGDTLGGLRQVTKKDFLAGIPTVPIGAIFPFAGQTAPQGYLFCDGSEVSQTQYKSLYDVIGLIYTSSPPRGADTFALPDFRGRFPLPPSDMANTTLPNIPQIGTKTPQQPGGVPISPLAPSATGRVTSEVAKKANIGKGTGSESKSLSIDNLPDHTHVLATKSGQYWAAGVPNPDDADTAANANRSFPTLGNGYGLPKTGSVDNRTLGASFDVMNPYVTVNYIIYTGVI